VSKSCVIVILAVVLTAPRADADILPGLPAVDSINASAQTGTIWPAFTSAVPRTDAARFDLWGWGVETEFELPVNKDSVWEATLAVGYNQLNLNARFGAGRRLRGTLRELPALSLYFGRAKREWYIGVTIAESELINGRLHVDPAPDTVDPGPIKLTASAFSAGVAVGYQTGPVFVELGYVGRYFPSLAYDGVPMGGFPSDLGERMYAGGFVLRVGGSLRVKKDAPRPRTIPCDGTTAEVTPPDRMELNHTCEKGVMTLRVYEPKK
jgi:hypothetical protein